MRLLGRTSRPAELDPLGVAASIGNHLCRTAYRQQGRATWMGTVQSDDPGGGVKLSYESAGPSFYGGTSGIAFFLATLHRLTGDPSHARMAIAALSHALSRTGDVHPNERAGFYTGLTGIAFAATHVGRWLDRPDFARTAGELLTRLTAQPVDDLLLDIVSGAAGAIASLLSLAQLINRHDLVDYTGKLADRILAQATRTDEGWSWDERATGFAARRNLTGFAHGAGGIAWGLLELYGVTRDERLRTAALGAIEYENRWFQRDLDNWPDFRNWDGTTGPPPCSVAWCHGAPGIGLSRLRAAQVDANPRHREDAAAAGRCTMRALAAGSPAGQDFSLCHGAAGFIEFLLLAGEGQAARETAAAAGRINRHDPASWICGVLRGGNPSLMLGLAGIGYVYLRIADPSVPSFLLLRPDQWLA